MDILIFLYGLQLFFKRPFISLTFIYDNPFQRYWSYYKFWCKITSSLLYSSIFTPLHRHHVICSRTLRPLFITTSSPRSYIKPRRPPPKNIHHYHLLRKARNRRQPRAPVLQSPLVPSFFQSLKTTVLSLASRLSLRWSQSFPGQPNIDSSTSVSQTPCSRGSLDTIDPTRLHNLCSSLDFIQLHRMCHLFNPTTVDQTIIQRTRQEVSRLQHILYSSDNPHPMIGASSIFICQHNKDNLPIVIDSGASKGLTPNRSDFVSFRPLNSKITGLGSQSEISGVGIVEWKIFDQNNTQRTIRTEAYYVPSANIRLYSPQHHFRQEKSGSLHITWNEAKLCLPNDDLSLSFPFNHINNLPIMLQAPSDLDPSSALVIEEDLSYHTSPVCDHILPAPILPEDTCSADQILNAIADEHNPNLSSAQLELLGWHYKLAHLSMHTIQRLMHPSNSLDNTDTVDSLTHPKVIATTHARSHTCTPPKCAACLLGKMERTSKSTTFSPGTDSRNSLKGNDLLPGQCISMGQYVVAHQGRTLTNSSVDKQKFNGGTVFTDHASGLIFNHHQVPLRTGETLVGKRLLEREAVQHGISIKGFLTDNGVFTSKESTEDLERKQQTIKFSGVGAHHQNGVAERTVKTISYLARTNLIHSALRWPSTHDLELWPFAMDYCIYVYNNTPDPDGLSPEEKWTGVKFPNYNHVRRLHPWGCPAYVLDPKLQDGKKLPKWSPRSRQTASTIVYLRLYCPKTANPATSVHSLAQQEYYKTLPENYRR